MRARTSLLLALVLGLVVLATGCGDAEDSTTTSGSTSSTALIQETTTTIAAVPLIFTANLNGANVVPPVTTNAKGTLTLTVQPDGTVDYVVTIKKLTNITVARLRGGQPGASTGVIVTLYDGPNKSGAFTGQLAEGSFTAEDMGGPLDGMTIADFVSLIESGNVFLNVGNASHKSGAICGPLMPDEAAEASSTTTVTPSTGVTPSTTAGGQSNGSTGNQALADLIGRYKQVESLSLDYAVTTSDGQTISGKMWEQAGKMLKTQSTVAGIENVIIMDLVGSTMTVYQPSTKQGTKTAMKMPVEDPAGYAEAVDVGQMQDLGTEVIDGETCRVVQYTTTDGGSAATVKMWLSENLGFPVKIISTSAGGQTITMTYSNIKVGPLPDDTFEVPADVEIMTTP